MNRCPLTDGQKQILRQVMTQALQGKSAADEAVSASDRNPLEELSPEQRQALLAFIKAQEQRDIPWKIKLLNDWLNGRDSGSVQFIRDLYVLQWLNRVRRQDLARYLEPSEASNSLRLKVGDRIEVSNELWEWVQEDGPCSREWFPCLVVAVTETSDGDLDYTNCVIRFDNGAEFEIQGIYQWNRYNWRFIQQED